MHIFFPVTYFFLNLAFHLEQHIKSQIYEFYMLKERKKAKKYINPMIISIIILLSHINISAQNVWVREHEPAMNLITEERLASHIGFLTDSLCQGRATGTIGNMDAAFWIQRRFEETGMLKFGDSYGKKVWVRKGLLGHNVMGMIPGSHKTHCERYIIIGAHFDHLGILEGRLYPGADSNASGVVAMTSIAEMIYHMKSDGRTYGCNMIFVAFDAKEHSMAGSKALWRLIEGGSLKDPVTGERITKDKIEFMVNIDQVGSTLSPIHSHRKDFIMMLGNETLKPIKRDMINMCNRFYGLNMDIGLDYYGSENFTKMFYRLSDQHAFAENGIPAVFFTSGITMNNNKTYDTTATLDLEILRKRIYLIYHWIDRMI